MLSVVVFPADVVYVNRGVAHPTDHYMIIKIPHFLDSAPVTTKFEADTIPVRIRAPDLPGHSLVQFLMHLLCSRVRNNPVLSAETVQHPVKE